MTDPSTIPAPTAAGASDERLVRIGVLGSGFVADFYLDGLRDVAQARAIANYSRIAAEAGKAIVCTKPLARNAQEAAEIVRIVREAGVMHGYAETEVFSPDVM